MITVWAVNQGVPTKVKLCLMLQRFLKLSGALISSFHTKLLQLPKTVKHAV